jgi:hypothetical protein
MDGCWVHGVDMHRFQWPIYFECKLVKLHINLNILGVARGAKLGVIHRSLEEICEIRTKNNS